MTDNDAREFCIGGDEGNYISWCEPNRVAVYGQLPLDMIFPRVGDVLKAKMESRRIGVFRFTEVERTNVPDDMFIAMVENTGFEPMSAADCVECRMKPCVCRACTECGAGFPGEDHAGGYGRCECECHDQRDRDGERCMDCGSAYIKWWADTPLFLEVIGGHYGPSLLCPTCFDRRARAQGTDLMWRPHRWDDEAQSWMEADVSAAIAEWRRSPEYRAEKARAAMSAGEA